MSITIDYKKFTLTVKELKSVHSELKNVFDKSKGRCCCYYFNRVAGEVAASDYIQVLVKQFPKIALEGATVDDNFRLEANLVWHIVKGRADNEVVCFERIETKRNDKHEYIDFIAKIGNDVIDLPNSDSGYFPPYQPVLQEAHDKCINTMIVDGEFTAKLIEVAERLKKTKQSTVNINIISNGGSDDIYIGFKNNDGEVVLDKFKTPNKQELSFNFNCQRLLQTLQAYKFDTIKYDTNEKPMYAKRGDVECLLSHRLWLDEDVIEKAHEDMAREQTSEGPKFRGLLVKQKEKKQIFLEGL